MVQIAPSILASDFARLGEEVAAVEVAGADLLHVDVMDGHFVPNISIGVPVVASLRRATDLPLDVHLMVSEPHDFIEAFAEAGADWISVHVEVCLHLEGTLAVIKQRGLKAGVVLNPSTPLTTLDEILPEADHVLLMGVNPGFSGQAFIKSVEGKVARLRLRIDEAGLPTLIEVDGGVNQDNAGRLRKAGADILVAATAIFGADDYGAAIKALRAGP
ncbi:ribulose-phosphate 3-epimerase [Nitrospinae bacterium AH_259_B05_G02_I21]|nr:ribulose-phosphate 3-epimerase [Nitrospinae bacterium AH_259_B05_G02_I21]MDA2932004.1 ribulose-phosphate 3-epimerase [Nitrospinae bacterium AH-259-F20]